MECSINRYCFQACYTFCDIVLNLCFPGVAIISFLVPYSWESYAVVTVSVLKNAYFASANNTI